MKGHWKSVEVPIYKKTVLNDPGITVKAVYELNPHKLS